jgi:hypothetical protein
LNEPWPQYTAKFELPLLENVAVVEAIRDKAAPVREREVAENIMI